MLYLRIICQVQTNEAFTVFPSRNFNFLATIFRSMIHLELIFVYGVR